MKQGRVSLLGLVVVIPLGIVVGAAQLALDGILTLARKLRGFEDEALAGWNGAMSGMLSNETIDKLMEEEDRGEAGQR